MRINNNIHPSWLPFFEDKRPELDKILSIIKESPFSPPAGLIFRFASQDVDKIRAVWLGQYPYPQDGAATGRSFEVAGLSDWTQPFRQSSLRNIVRAIYKCETGETLPWGEVRAKIADGSFPILPPDELWNNLEAQGVLFLNAYLTVRGGEPGSHKALWRDFARKLITFIDERRGADAAWFLWGTDAKSFADCIKRGRVYASRHPMMSTHAADDFLNNTGFTATRDEIRWSGM
jgi:uracil-DNA glycosylase